MQVYAIGDLHLPGGDLKPMDVFGPHWERHFEKIAADWRANVQADDLVLIPGDISWAIRLEDAMEDLCAIGNLPGKKVLLRGNHDYWWSAIGRVRRSLPAGMHAVQNDCVDVGEYVVCGTRGWTLPLDAADSEDVRIYERELLRMEMTLKAAVRIADSRPILCMTHFPPLTDACRETGFTRLLEQYGAAHVFYGHLHGPSLKQAFRGEHNGVHYHQVSCDGLNFCLYRL